MYQFGSSEMKRSQNKPQEGGRAVVHTELHGDLKCTKSLTMLISLRNNFFSFQIRVKKKNIKNSEILVVMSLEALSGAILYIVIFWWKDAF